MRKINKIVRLFFDFYVLNEVWFKTLGMKEFGYKTEKILPYNKERVIDETFKETLADIKAKLIVSFEQTIRSEARHFRTRCLNSSWAPVSVKGRKKIVDFYKKNGSSCRWSLHTIREAFFLKGWESQYGGKRWGVGADFLIKLKESTSIKDDIFYIDRIFDLQHNNGFILNKTRFKYLDYCSFVEIKGKSTYLSYLDVRFKLNPEQMLDLCSFWTKKVFIANKNYL